MEECSSNQQKTCCCPCHQQHEHDNCHEEHDDKTAWLIEVADAAWMEVLKDKIKEHIETTQSDHMKELAKIVSEGNNNRWRHMMEKKKAMWEFKEKLHNFFGQSK